MSHIITLVKASHLQPVITFLDLNHMPTDKYLAKCGLRRDVCNNPELLIPEFPIWHLFQYVANRENMPDFGCQVSEMLSIDALGTFGKHVINAPNLWQALHRFIDSMVTYSNCPPFWLKETEFGLWLCRQGSPGITIGEDLIEQHVITLMVQLVRAFTKPQWQPEQVKIQANNYDALTNIDQFSNSFIIPNQSFTAIFIEYSLLHQTTNELTSGTQSNTYKIKEITKDLLQNDYFTHPVSAHDVAFHYGMSVRSLQRKLKSENTTLREIINRDIYQKAKVLLKKENAIITDIAYELGYSELANFNRAFKQHAGISPLQYKKGSYSQVD